MYTEEEVSESVGREYAKSIGANFVLTSALNKVGINEVFEETAHKYLENRGKVPKCDRNTVVLNNNNGNPDQQNKKKCCN